MSNHVKNYFLAPSWDYPPNGLLTIGNIIVSPKRPIPPLFSATSDNKESSSHGTQDARAAPAHPHIRSFKDDVEWTRERAVAGKFGVWTKFLETLGADVGGSFSSEHSEALRFDRVETEEFFPDDAYLRRAVASAGVRAFLQRHRLRPKTLYVVVGVKTVTGAAAGRREAARELGGEADVAVDGALLGAVGGVPVSVGPSAGWTRRSKDSVAFGGSSDFVFAFRVRRVKIVASGDVVQDDHHRGAMLGLPGEGEDEERDGDGGLGFRVVGVDDEDFVDGGDEVSVASVLDVDETANVCVLSRSI